VPVGGKEEEQVVAGRNLAIGGEGLHAGSGTEAMDEFRRCQLRAAVNLTGWQPPRHPPDGMKRRCWLLDQVQRKRWNASGHTRLQQDVPVTGWRLG
jgi:hypothetical protein